MPPATTKYHETIRLPDLDRELLTVLEVRSGLTLAEILELLTSALVICERHGEPAPEIFEIAWDILNGAPGLTLPNPGGNGPCRRKSDGRTSTSS